MAQSIDEMMQKAPVLTLEPFAEEKKEVEIKQEPEAVVFSAEEERMTLYLHQN